MKRIETRLWAGGRTHAVSFTFDDGRYEDYRLVETFNKYGVKGTFHISNPGFLESCGYKVERLVDPADYKSLYEGHEISCHLLHHPFPKWQPTEAILQECLINKQFLEERCGYPVRSMSYPFASFDTRVINILRAAGMEYSRTAGDTHAFGLPEDYMRWDPTCHWSEAEGLIDKFFSPMNYDFMRLFYIWGHSYELCNEEKWKSLERMLGKLSGRDNVWYATGIEIYDYMQALRGLKFSTDCTTVYNPSATPVWFEADRKVYVAEPGKVTIIG